MNVPCRDRDGAVSKHRDWGTCDFAMMSVDCLADFNMINAMP
jgi:hypothetical protein